MFSALSRTCPFCASYSDTLSWGAEQLDNRRKPDYNSHGEIAAVTVKQTNKQKKNVKTIQFFFCIFFLSSILFPEAPFSGPHFE